MRILFVAHNFVFGNGQGRINYEVARFAARAGHQLALLADRVDPDLAGEPNVRWIPLLHRPRRPNLIGGWRAARAADRIVRKLRPEFDVVVGAGYTLGELHEVNLCQFVHGAWIRSLVHVARLSRGPWSWYQWVYSRLNERLEKIAYLAARVVVAPSEKIRSELIDIGVTSDKIRVIYNGVDPQQFYPRGTALADPQERKELGLPHPAFDRPLAVFVGDIRTPRKNLDSVLKAMTEIPSLYLAVVGALENSPFPGLAEQLGLSARVTFLGFRHDVNRVMRSADIFVFPSRYEAGTLVLTEAAASGLPLVTSATAGGAEVFGPESSRTIGDPDDLPALIAAIRHFSEDRDVRRSAALAARATAEKLTWFDMARRYLELFEVVSRREPQPAELSAGHEAA
jgi:glycosyltransferase involved in cell wall biosynthesis